ncbi:MAG: tRNA (adenosine(37)-N6)-threonylcarbamoyltransferase complex dimerization subunit type 1 TsaB [Clostridia bacterium]|nr:tRNA (adenosine(37)-N6)-threonylcarbamoyltransferase complex dimerization subunit type 1 TsaB [Clostridia bacterium]
MKILAIDSSGLVASVAVLEEKEDAERVSVLASYTLNYKKTHSQTLLPMIDEIKTMLELDLKTIDAIAIASGPGSFTGLRIGSATAKGLGLALQKPIVAIPTVDALAYNYYGSDRLICPIMDARRNQVYTGIYTFKNGEFIKIRKQCAIQIEELTAQLNQMNGQVVFLGDGVPVYATYLNEHMQTSFEFAPAHLSRQSAAALGIFALEDLNADRNYVEDAMEHKPDYLRMAQAERELEEKKKAQEQ